MSCCNNNQNCYHDPCGSAFNQSVTQAAQYAQYAQTQANKAEDLWEEFNALYLGAFAVAPTQDNEGNPLQEGALYWNSVSNEMFAWNGTVWVATNFNEFTPFLATGTTTARNLATRFADMANVRDFGATGAGNDIAAFVAASNTGKQVFVPDGTYTVTASSQADVDSVLSMLSRLHLFCNQLTINFGAGQFNISSQTELNVTNPDRLKIIGATPILTKIVSIQSVTGSAGNWSVVANLADATGFSVGDIVVVKNVKPGVQAPGTYGATRPVKGAIQLQFFATGSSTIALNGTSGSITGSTLNSVAQSGDFLIADGKVKRMTGVTTNAFTVDAGNAAPIAYSGKQYWYTMQDSTIGTATVTGTAVTGIGTSFLTSANNGDFIAFNGGGMKQIASVNSNTSITLTQSHPTIAVGTTYGIVCPGENHEGAWEITNISGNQVTWKNTFAKSYGPPVNLVIDGDVVALKTKLKYGTTSGFVVDGGVYDIEQLALQGGNGANNVGIDLRGKTLEGIGHVSISNYIAVSGFDYGMRLSSGATAQADNPGQNPPSPRSTYFSSQFVRGVNVAGGEARLGGSVISGVTGIGILISEGAFARLSDARILGCSSTGIRMEVGGSTWADFVIVGHNGSRNLDIIGGADIHFVGMRTFASSSDGFYLQNGGYGRASGTLALCNNGSGLSFFQGQMEVNQLISIGNGNDGATFSRGDYSCEESAFGFNGQDGLNGLTISTTSATTNCQFIGNNNGIRIQSGAIIYAPSCGFANNITNDAIATTGGMLFINGYQPDPGSTFSPAAVTTYTPQNNGTMINSA